MCVRSVRVVEEVEGESLLLWTDGRTDRLVRTLVKKSKDKEREREKCCDSKILLKLIRFLIRVIIK